MKSNSRLRARVYCSIRLLRYEDVHQPAYAGQWRQRRYFNGRRNLVNTGKLFMWDCHETLYKHKDFIIQHVWGPSKSWWCSMLMNFVIRTCEILLYHQKLFLTMALTIKRPLQIMKCVHAIFKFIRPLIPKKLTVHDRHRLYYRWTNWCVFRNRSRPDVIFSLGDATSTVSLPPFNVVAAISALSPPIHQIQKINHRQTLSFLFRFWTLMLGTAIRYNKRNCGLWKLFRSVSILSYLLCYYLSKMMSIDGLIAIGHASMVIGLRHINQYVTNLKAFCGDGFEPLDVLCYTDNIKTI